MKKIFILIFTLQLLIQVSAQDQTVGVFINESDAFEGHTLFSPLATNTTYLIDNCGQNIHTWVHRHNPAFSSRLLENGSLLRAGKPVDPNDSQNLEGGFLELISWDNQLIWSYEFNQDTLLQHHDIIQLPNENILFLAWERNTPQEQVELGRDSNGITYPFLWTEVLFEIKPIGNDEIDIVWEWHSRDHLVQDIDDQASNYGVVEEEIGKIDINYIGPSSWAGPDWWHANAIDYNPELDHILINARNNNELWIIDHSTTSDEAASDFGGDSGKGGDLLFRWGNPEAYRKGTLTDLKMFGSHGTYWIPEGLPNAGKIMFFNNGQDRAEGAYSTIEMIDPFVDLNGVYERDTNDHYLPLQSELVYQSQVPEDFYSPYLANAQQLPNGNVLINEGTEGHLFEVNSLGDIVWDYINPVGDFGIANQFEIPFRNTIFRAYKYGNNYPAFIGKNLKPKEVLEGYTDISICEPLSNGQTIIDHGLDLYFDQYSGYLILETGNSENSFLEVVDILGRIQIIEEIEVQGVHRISTSELPSGIYFARMHISSEQVKVLPFIK